MPGNKDEESRKLIESTLKENDYNLITTSRALGVTRRTLINRISALNIWTPPRRGRVETSKEIRMNVVSCQVTLRVPEVMSVFLTHLRKELCESFCAELEEKCPRPKNEDSIPQVLWIITATDLPALLYIVDRVVPAFVALQFSGETPFPRSFPWEIDKEGENPSNQKKEYREKVSEFLKRGGKVTQLPPVKGEQVGVVTTHGSEFVAVHGGFADWWEGTQVKKKPGQP